MQFFQKARHEKIEQKAKKITNYKKK